MVDDSEPLYALIERGRVIELSNNREDLARKAHREGMSLWRMVQI